jgi:hypothetical protein
MARAEGGQNVRDRPSAGTETQVAGDRDGGQSAAIPEEFSGIGGRERSGSGCLWPTGIQPKSHFGDPKKQAISHFGRVKNNQKVTMGKSESAKNTLKSMEKSPHYNTPHIKGCNRGGLRCSAPR